MMHLPVMVLQTGSEGLVQSASLLHAVGGTQVWFWMSQTSSPWQ